MQATTELNLNRASDFLEDESYDSIHRSKKLITVGSVRSNNNCGGNHNNNGNSTGNDDSSGDRMCRDFLRNCCSRGARCKYLHAPPTDGDADDISLTSGEDRTTTITSCRDFENGRCFRVSCRFAHNKRHRSNSFRLTEKSTGTKHQNGVHTEIDQTGSSSLATSEPHSSTSPTDFLISPDPRSLGFDIPRRPVCKDFIKGNCKRAALCKYRHLTLNEYETDLLMLGMKRAAMVMTSPESLSNSPESATDEDFSMPCIESKRIKLTSFGQCQVNHSNCIVDTGELNRLRAENSRLSTKLVTLEQKMAVLVEENKLLTGKRRE